MAQPANVSEALAAVRSKSDNAFALTDAVILVQLEKADGFAVKFNAGFSLYTNDKANRRTTEYSEAYLSVATKYGSSFYLLRADTWRANLDWAKKLGMSKEEMVDLSRTVVRLHTKIKKENQECHKIQYRKIRFSSIDVIRTADGRSSHLFVWHSWA